MQPGCEQGRDTCEMGEDEDGEREVTIDSTFCPVLAFENTLEDKLITSFVERLRCVGPENLRRRTPVVPLAL